MGPEAVVPKVGVGEGLAGRHPPFGVDVEHFLEREKRFQLDCFVQLIDSSDKICTESCLS